MTEPNITLSQLEELAALDVLATKGPWSDQTRTGSDDELRNLDVGMKSVALWLLPDDARFLATLRNHAPAVIALAIEALEARERRALLEAHRKDSTYMDLGLCDERREEAALTKP